MGLRGGGASPATVPAPYLAVLLAGGVEGAREATHAPEPSDAIELVPWERLDS